MKEIKEKLRKLGKFMILRIPGVHYSFCKEYIAFIRMLIIFMGALIVVDNLLGSGSVLGKLDKVYELFLSVEYIEGMIIMHLMTEFFLIILLMRFNRIPYLIMGYFMLNLIVYASTDKNIWQRLLVIYYLCFIFNKIMSKLEYRANVKGYSILNPGSIIRVRIVQRGGFDENVNLKEWGKLEE